MGCFGRFAPSQGRREKPKTIGAFPLFCWNSPHRIAVGQQPTTARSLSEQKSTPRVFSEPGKKMLEDYAVVWIGKLKTERHRMSSEFGQGSPNVLQICIL